MKILSSQQAYSNLYQGVRARTSGIPDKNEAVQFRDGLILPNLRDTKFKIAEKSKVFTIGSCFARNVESLLLHRGLEVPVARFEIQPDELPHPAPHLLNEYNAGTILQRLRSVTGSFYYNDDMGIEEMNGGFIDLFLHVHTKPVPLARLLERRRQIDVLYQEIISSETVIITFGLVESWFDSKFRCYLNKAPSKKLATAEAGRFLFHRMDVQDVIEQLSLSIEALNSTGKKNILVTVSPVPLEATFTNQHAVMANSYSKSVLRVAAEILCEKYDNLEYFPSYEIALSAGTSGLGADNVHILPGVVDLITDHMISAYMGAYDETKWVDPGNEYWQTMMALYGSNADDHLDAINHIMTQYPQHWFGLDLMAHYSSIKGDLAAAIEYTLKALAMEPTQIGLIHRIGRLYEEAGNLDAAEDFFRRGTLLPDGIEAHRWLEGLLEKKASLQKAEDSPVSGDVG